MFTGQIKAEARRANRLIVAESEGVITMPIVSRDPFARTEIHYSLVTTDQECTWCGMPGPNGKLRKYRIETDGGRTFEISGLFC